MRDVEGGSSLGSALEKYPNLFSPTYISLVKAGESSGNLDKVLERLADRLERTREFRGKVKGAMVYPVIILIAMAVVISALMIFVVPQLSSLYDDFGLALPLQTRLLIGLSDFMVGFWWLILIGIFGGMTLFRKFKKTPAGKRLVDSFTLRLPIFGKLTKQVLLVEFTATLGLLVGAGIHLLDALSILTDAMGNVLFKESLQDVAKKVEKGLPMGTAFEHHEIFPTILSQMVKVGEETGTLDDSLGRLSTYFENESNQTVKGLTTAIEPLIMVILGVSVGFIVFSIITPIYNLTTQF